MNLEFSQIITHIVGFLIVLWLLKKYAWGPLLAMMEERRNKIAGEFQKIEEGKADVAQLAADYDKKLKEIDLEKRAKLVEAVNEGKKVAEEIKTAAHEEAKKITAKAKAELVRDVAKAKVQLKSDMVAITIAAAEKIIKEELDDQKHHQLIGQFIDGLDKV
ncbi:MAG: F0F1 ATP synthase subunit B [FCB group bacterium]|nr:F0F1 ATP synthase subunit B [FCB group bacterium]